MSTSFTILSRTAKDTAEGVAVASTLPLEDIHFDPSLNYRWNLGWEAPERAQQRMEADLFDLRDDETFTISSKYKTIADSLRAGKGNEERIQVVDLKVGNKTLKNTVVAGFTRVALMRHLGQKVVHIDHKGTMGVEEARLLQLSENSTTLRERPNWVFEREAQVKFFEAQGVDLSEGKISTKNKIASNAAKFLGLNGKEIGYLNRFMLIPPFIKEKNSGVSDTISFPAARMFIMDQVEGATPRFYATEYLTAWWAKLQEVRGKKGLEGTTKGDVAEAKALLDAEQKEVEPDSALNVVAKFDKAGNEIVNENIKAGSEQAENLKGKTDRDNEKKQLRASVSDQVNALLDMLVGDGEGAIYDEEALLCILRGVYIAQGKASYDEPKALDRLICAEVFRRSAFAECPEGFASTQFATGTEEPVLDEDGQPKVEWKMKLDDNGKPVLGKDGKPVVEQITKTRTAKRSGAKLVNEQADAFYAQALHPDYLDDKEVSIAMACEFASEFAEAISGSKEYMKAIESHLQATTSKQAKK